MKLVRDNIDPLMNMPANLINVTHNISWAIMVDIAVLVTTYGSMVLATGLDPQAIECWILLQMVVVYFLMPCFLSYKRPR